jgi:hypothetical protein
MHRHGFVTLVTQPNMGTEIRDVATYNDATVKTGISFSVLHLLNSCLILNHSISEKGSLCQNTKESEQKRHDDFKNNLAFCT